MADRILLVKVAALGDAVMASTLVPAIRARWPNATLGWVAGRSVASLVRCMRDVDRVIEVDDRALLRGSRWTSGRALINAWRAIGRGWQLALVAHTDPRYMLLARASGATEVRSFAQDRGPRAGRWHGAEYLRLLDGEPDAHPASERRSRHAPPLASLRLDAMQSPPDVPGDGPLVVVAPGGARNVLRDDPLRRWPVASWERVVSTLTRSGCRVAVAGAAVDAVEGARCARAGAHDLTGRTSIVELLSLLRQAASVVTHDSGMMHLAILLGRPTVALFGPTRPEERVPDDADVTVLSRAAGLACAPCYDGRDYAPCGLNRCLTGVSVTDVVSAVKRQVDARR